MGMQTQLAEVTADLADAKVSVTAALGVFALHMDKLPPEAAENICNLLDDVNHKLAKSIFAL